MPRLPQTAFSEARADAEETLEHPLCCAPVTTGITHRVFRQARAEAQETAEYSTQYDAARTDDAIPCGLVQQQAHHLHRARDDM